MWLLVWIKVKVRKYKKLVFVLNIFMLYLFNVGLILIKKKDIIFEYIKECYLKLNFNIFV